MTNLERINFKPKNQSIFLQEMQKRVDRESNWLLILTFLHLPLGLILYLTGSLGIVHPLAVFALGMYWAVSKKGKLEWIAFVAAYLIGCEVLWRMAEIPVFWEFGKYGSSAIMIAALLRRGHYYPPPLPTIFLILLIPACLITVTTRSYVDTREVISFNLSGPFFLFISCWFFSYLSITQPKIKKLLIFLFIPLLSVATTTLFYTVANSEDISFNDESNFATSGGFGPNQVSSMLGLGVFIGLACYFLFNDKLKFKLYFIIGSLFLAAQSVLTFSRGGMYNAIGAIVILIFFQFQNVTDGIKRILPFILVIGIFLLIIFPFLNDFTGGKLQDRFEDTETTGRMDIIESDLQILAENPIWGVGLGNARRYREKFLGHSAVSHTEFSRLVSEHGLFGIVAILILIGMTVMNLLKQNSVFRRALVAGAVLWCCLFMFNAGMRLAAPSFLWGLSFITVIEPRFNSRTRIFPKRLNSAKITT